MLKRQSRIFKKRRKIRNENYADAYVRKHELAKALRETKGHPLYSFTEENENLVKKYQILEVH